MYYSKFNYISDYGKNGEHLLLNFLSRSSDIVDEELADAIARKKTDLPPDIAAYLKDRGYVFPDERSEASILAKLWETNQNNRKSRYVINLDSFDHQSFRDFRNDRVYPVNESAIVYNTGPSAFDLTQGRMNNFGIRNGTLMTTTHNLPHFKELISDGSISTLFLFLQPDEIQLPPGEDTDLFLDTLIVEKMLNVNIVIRVSESTISSLHSLVNYFIGKGWPFHKNFQCILAPEPGMGCIFGYWYPSLDLMKSIFREYAAHPQTEFCSLEKMIGARDIHALIWTGSPPRPEVAFCESMSGLTVLTGDNTVHHCLNGTPEHEDEWNRECTEYRPCAVSSPDCPFMLSCGGGCRLLSQESRCPPFRDLLEISIEYYFDELVRRLHFSEKYRRSP